jgi:hypothetical protein
MGRGGGRARASVPQTNERAGDVGMFFLELRAGKEEGREGGREGGR